MAVEQTTPLSRPRSVAGVKRLILDGAAILGAILVAFALDAWWDDRQEATRTEELVEAIASEFTEAVIQLDSIIAENERFIAAKGLYLSRTPPSHLPIPDDSLSFYRGGSSDFQIYNAAFGALSTLKSIGGLERIRDPILRNALGGWTGELDDLKWEEHQLFVASQGNLDALVSAQALAGITLGLLATSGEVIGDGRVLAENEQFRQSLARVVLALVFYQKDLVRVRGRAAELARQLGG
jgi:hypothetical protein